MTHLEILQHGDIHELRFDRPPVNALDANMIREVRFAIEAAPASGARGMVLSGRTGMFSGGLDVPSLLQLDHAGMMQVWNDFVGLMSAIASSPIPIVAAITGHSPAGGAVLSIYCDYRIMARGAYKIGLNEVQVGLVVPNVVQGALRRLVGNHRAERLMVAGAMIDPEHAYSVGLVDELMEAELVVGRAINWLQELLKLPPQAMSETRRIARADLIKLFDSAPGQHSGLFVDYWFSEESQRVLQAMVVKLKSKA